MFTGITAAVIPVVSLTPYKNGLRVKLSKSARLGLKLGESISLDGVCSTVVSVGATSFDVEYMAETLSKTTVGLLKKGQKVNMERSLRVGDRVDGHFVQGHVDSTAKITTIKKAESLWEISIALPSQMKPLVALHGSITVNGVSLTVARLTEKYFMVAIIPYTLKHTNLGILSTGDVVNIEVDSLARYVAAALKHSE